jgi:hypothetical protein
MAVFNLMFINSVEQRGDCSHAPSPKHKLPNVLLFMKVVNNWLDVLGLLHTISQEFPLTLAASTHIKHAQTVVVRQVLDYI